jgi:hypothetical protein
MTLMLYGHYCQEYVRRNVKDMRRSNESEGEDFLNHIVLVCAFIGH